MAINHRDDNDRYQAVSEAFRQAAMDLPFMPLKFPPEGDFNNEEVFRYNSHKLP